MDQIIAERADNHLDQSVNARNVDGSFQNTCPEAAATQVIQDMGVDASFDEVIDNAVDRGLCNHDGSVDVGKIDNVRQMLDDHGVSATTTPEGATVEGIVGDLRNGKGVITGVDQSAMHDQPSTQQGVDHLVNVIGFDEDEHGNPTALHVNETGTPGDSGRDLVVDVEVFREAFEGERGGMSITTDSARSGFYDDK